MPAFGTGPLLLGHRLVLLACCARRCVGRVQRAADRDRVGVAAPQPDILISATGTTVAVRARTAAHLLRAAKDVFALKEWLAADADGRNVTDPRLHDGVLLR